MKILFDKDARTVYNILYQFWWFETTELREQFEIIIHLNEFVNSRQIFFHTNVIFIKQVIK